MKTKSVQLLITCCLLLLFTSCKKSIDQSFTAPEEVASSAFFSNHNSSSQVLERPFKGKIVGSFISQPTADPTIYSGGATATGSVTHLGAFSKVTTDVINLVSSMVQGTFIMTSPAGEQIMGNYNGIFIFGSVPGTFSWELNANITGGSGRFSNATGEFVFLASGTYVMTDGVVNGDYTETFNGTITF
ncbi:MAG TPA: hypothetical protein VF144_20945 [Chitinophagaceae bacterium]